MSMAQEFEPACRRMEWLDPFYKAVWEKAFADAIPISGTFELTPRCNFDCRMCYVHLKPNQIPLHGRELTAKEWLRIAEEAKEAGTTWLCITGGEPLMHPEFETIYRELAQMGFFITLQTNASLIQGTYADLLAQYPPRGVKITLYGSNDEVYGEVCQVEKGFTRVDEGIRTLLEMKIPVQLVSTVIRQNEDDVKKMAFYAYLHKLPWAMTGGIKKSVRGAESEVDSLRVQEKLEESKRQEIRWHLEKAPLDITRKPCTYCRDYRLGYWVTWDGAMKFCGFMKAPDIPVRDMSFQNAWDQLIRFEEQLEWPKACKTCKVSKACFKCAATLETECGSLNQVTEEFCNRVKKYFDEEKGEWKI